MEIYWLFKKIVGWLTHKRKDTAMGWVKKYRGSRVDRTIFFLTKIPVWFLLLIIQKSYFLVKAIVFIWMTCQLYKVNKYSKQLLWVFVHSWSKFQTLIIAYWEQECPRLDNGCISFDYQDGYCISRRFWQILLKLNQEYFLNLILIINRTILCVYENWIQFL